MHLAKDDTDLGGLGQVGIETRFVATLDIGRRAEGGQGQCRGVAEGAHTADQAETMPVGQPDVTDDDIKLLVNDDVESLSHGTDSADLAASKLQTSRQQLRRVCIVFDKQGFHGTCSRVEGIGSNLAVLSLRRHQVIPCQVHQDRADASEKTGKIQPSLPPAATNQRGNWPRVRPPSTMMT